MFTIEVYKTLLGIYHSKFSESAGLFEKLFNHIKNSDGIVCSGENWFDDISIFAFQTRHVEAECHYRPWM